MRRFLYLSLFALFLSQPCLAGTHYHIEVIQIGDSTAYDAAYEGMLDGLARYGLVKDHNLTVGRTVLETRPDPSLWQRLIAAFRMRSITSSIIKAKPDLVITLGTEATDSFRDRIMNSGIPVVFSGVCRSETAGAGVTIQSRPSDIITAAILALPKIDRLGIIRTSSPEAAAFSREMERQAELLGMQVTAKEIGPSESIRDAARELLAKGVDAFIIPPDISYERNGWKAGSELIEEATSKKVPCISALPNPSKGTFMSPATDFEAIGNITAGQANAILTQGTRLCELSVITYTDQDYVVDLSASKDLDIWFRPRSSTLLSLNY